MSDSSTSPFAIRLTQEQSETLSNLIKQQQAEINALKAHIESIRTIATQCTGHEPSLSALLKTIDDIPHQSLAEHDAEVAEKAIQWAMLQLAEATDKLDGYDVARLSNRYVSYYVGKIKAGDL